MLTFFPAKLVLPIVRSGIIAFALSVSLRIGAADHVAKSMVNVTKKDVAIPKEPRIVNVYCFVREEDYRLSNSKQILFDATKNQIQLFKKFKLPATFAVQYDALIDKRYEDLFKKSLGPKDEIAAWWEIPQALVEKAGLKWRGSHEWDPAANVGFSPGYTPAERRKLVDVYMAGFKRIFGHYPATVGSWFIDEVTLEYMAKRYGIIASCNCKDQVGTDFYTMWGGYWDQAYYPSRLDAYMPAQTESGQINVPIFRMLGSDPIYQHGTTPGMYTLEPVYSAAGGSQEFVRWFFNSIFEEPSLAFAYAQAGQENSFGWDAMKTGLTFQAEFLANKVRSGQIKVETLAQSGKWFKNNFPVTPPTSVVALTDWRNQNRKTVWYDSRFYRLNLLWQDGLFYIRDIHCFDESIVSSTHSTPLTKTALAYETLPVMDTAIWSQESQVSVGMWPVLILPNGNTASMVPSGVPIVSELNSKDLSIKQNLNGGGFILIICSETGITCSAKDARGSPLKWAWNLVGGRGQSLVLQNVTSNSIAYTFSGANYEIHTLSGIGFCKRLISGVIQIKPNNFGHLKLILNVTKN